MDHIGHMIDGSEVPSVSGETFPSIDPSTGLEIARIAFGTVQDVDLAVMLQRGCNHAVDIIQAGEIRLNSEGLPAFIVDPRLQALQTLHAARGKNNLAALLCKEQRGILPKA